MARRRKISKGKSRRSFRRGTKTNRRNKGARPMRGGIRL